MSLPLGNITMKTLRLSNTYVIIPETPFDKIRLKIASFFIGKYAQHCADSCYRSLVIDDIEQQSKSDFQDRSRQRAEVRLRDGSANVKDR